MNAGELRKSEAKQSRAFVARLGWGVSLSAIGLWIMYFTFRFETEKHPLINSVVGILVLIIGGRLLSSARSPGVERAFLRGYQKAWQSRVWVKESLEKRIGLLIPDNNPDMARYAFGLVGEMGVGPYSPQELFSIIHSAKMYEIERSFTLGMIDLLGSNHLVRVPDGFGWSEDIREILFALYPMPDDFDPNNPNVYSHGVPHHANMD